ncbi:MULTISPECIES: IclR family transcriptional regulator [unclassified Streptomyces]|uniref:IclR family transcriptional regulator n=1 Tax=unclassified Streptomyces TaxID=2593676 RepID=UPI00224CBC63|nr:MULTISPECIES: IclR family transcriptional regulator [unclassified Streptomyces]MCX5440546.1 IclR family transcriptional regulator [Streptomyces sp. NBC_00063]WSE18037.1 IclR family transcriptional regulator [Streptomyces sp. NBC_01397]WUB93070.1 IclR family transcriptional regulator [Streptomyces sp. NBC_00569]
MTENSPKTGGPGVLQGADRALLALLSFTERRPEWGVSEIAREHGWDKAVAQRILATLTARAFLTCDSTTRRYRLGPAVSRLARVGEHSGVLPSLVRPVLAGLLRETGESVVLNVPNGSGYRCAAAVDGTGPVRYTAIVGALMPGHAGASGHAIFAHYPEAEIRQIFGATPLQRFNDHTVTDFDDLLRVYGDVREKGHSVSLGEYDEAVAAIAAPVFQAGTVAASLTVIGPSHRIVRDADRITRLVVEGAHEATAAFGP